MLWACKSKSKSATITNSKKRENAHVHAAVHCHERRQPINRVWPNIKNLTPGVNGKTVKLWPSKPNSASETLKTSRSSAAAMEWNSWGDWVPSCLLKHPVALFVAPYDFPPKKSLGKNKLFFFSWKIRVTEALFVIPPRAEQNIFSTRAKYKYANICVRAGRNFLLIPSPTNALGMPLRRLFSALLGGLQLWQRLKSPPLVTVPAWRTFKILNLDRPVCIFWKKNLHSNVQIRCDTGQESPATSCPWKPQKKTGNKEKWRRDGVLPSFTVSMLQPRHFIWTGRRFDIKGGTKNDTLSFMLMENTWNLTGSGKSWTLADKLLLVHSCETHI